MWVSKMSKLTFDQCFCMAYPLSEFSWCRLMSVRIDEQTHRCVECDARVTYQS